MRVRIWDWPTRLFHWLLVVLIPLQWWTAEQDMMDLHILSGTVMLGLLLFRLLWGVFGSSTARFSNFVKGPRAVVSYLSGRAAQVLGHNPLGGWSVMAMLGLLSLQVGLGLIASDEDGLYSGPLSHLVDAERSESAAEWHEQMFDLLVVLIALHVAAILFYALFKRRNLIGPMLVGTGEAPGDAAPMQPVPAWRFLIAAALAGAGAWWIESGA
ncbi:MAG: cytochrome b/b6 domain-containing protein [Pseudomonadota bacterium]|nr:cytochrome b/b6 domain-containing protein [Pseudomonadota bacterium]